MEMRRDVYQAIADPTRRQIMELLATDSLTLNGVADQFHISRPAVSKHIRILSECGLVIIRKQGRERVCEPHFEKLREVTSWTEYYSRFWDKKLTKLQRHLMAAKKKNKL